MVAFPYFPLWNHVIRCTLIISQKDLTTYIDISMMDNVDLAIEPGDIAQGETMRQRDTARELEEWPELEYLLAMPADELTPWEQERLAELFQPRYIIGRSA